jgi:hypothetical protein
MTILSKSCKAISAESLRRFKDWTEKLPPLTVETLGEEQAAGSEKGKTVFCYYYLHHDYTVSAGITAGEKVVFDQVSDEWKDFCNSTLHSPLPG